MPAKVTTMYVCSNCDAQFPKWNGRCLECGGWGTLRKLAVPNCKETDAVPAAVPAETIDFASLDGKSATRIPAGIGEVDRVLGGGIMPGSLVLLSGEPGIGKSTMLAQIASRTSGRAPVFYASGEESAGQVKSRFDRIGIKQNTNLFFIAETNVEKVLAAVREKKPGLLVVDSIQSMYTAAVTGEPGGQSQIRAATVKFLEAAKEGETAIILVGHVTKDGVAAGPKTLEHIVDTVIYLESEPARDYRILRATKNRFGSTNEIGIFEMTGEGFNEVPDPSFVFVESDGQGYSGSTISSVIEGTRPFLVEVQALVSKTVFGYPQRKAAGFDANRLQILAAVMTKRTKINLSNQDIILNIVGGLKLNDPSLDLAVCFSIASSLLNQPIDRRTLILGEIGLGGEVRPVNKLEQKLAEAAKLGFTRAIIPDKAVKAGKLEVKKIANVAQFLDVLAK